MTNRPHAGRAATRKSTRRESADEPLLTGLLRTFDIDFSKLMALLGKLVQLRLKHEPSMASQDGLNYYRNTAHELQWRTTVDAVCRRHGIDPADLRALHQELYDHPLIDMSKPWGVTH